MLELPAASPPLASVPLATATLAYSTRSTRELRPTLVPTIGVLSILVAMLSGVFNAGKGASTYRRWVRSMMPTAGPAALAGSAKTPTGLTRERSDFVIKSIQQYLSGETALTPLQINAIRTAIEAPHQRLVPPVISGSPLLFVTSEPNGAAWIRFGSNQNRFSGVDLFVGRNGRSYSGFKPPTGPALPCIIIVLSLLLVADAILLFVAGLLMFWRNSRGRPAHLLYVRTKVPLAILASIAYMSLDNDLIGPSAIGVITPPFVGRTLALVLLGTAYPAFLFVAFRTPAMREYFLPTP